MAVIFLRRFCIFEYHTGSNRISPLRIRVIKALNMPWQFRQVQILLNLCQQTSSSLLRIQLLHSLQPVKLSLLGISQRHFEKFLFIPSLRNNKRDILRFKIRQKRNNNFLRHISKFRLNLTNSIRQQLLRSLVKAALKIVGNASHHCPTPYVHIIYECHIVIRLKREDVNIANHCADNNRLCTIFLNKVILHLQFLSLLKLHILCKAHHLRHQIIRNRLSIASKNLLYRRNIICIFLMRNSTHTAPSTILDMIFQTDLKLLRGNASRRYSQTAPTQRKQLIDEPENCLCHHNI